MPREWHDRHAVNKIEDESKRQFYRSIIAEKKPYFMRYIYPELSKEYNTYIKNTNRNALRQFGLTVDELYAMPYKSLSDEQREFLFYYERKMPIGTHDCVMNRICKRFEEEFDNYISKNCTGVHFDYSFMKSDEEYTPKQYRAIKALFDEYNRKVVSHAIVADCNRKTDELDTDIADINAEFRKACDEICPNAYVLCNIVLDMCYKSSSTKAFVWNICAPEIIQNLLSKNGNKISYPHLDSYGELEYGGNRFRFDEVLMEDNE